MSKKSKSFDEIVEETIRDMSEPLKYTIEELAEITDEYWGSSRWHVDILESRGVVDHLEQGREKLRRLKRGD